jgi:hypothetical protein
MRSGYQAFRFLEIAHGNEHRAANVAGGGLGDELRQPVFSLGMKGVKPENTAKVGIS